MNFFEACRKKFDLGAKEHKQTWSSEHIQYRKEMQDEITDLYNYAELEHDEEVRREIQGWCKYMWKRLNY